MSAPLVLAIDAGGTAVKVVVFDAGGHIVAQRAADVRNDHYPDGRVERDGEAFWTSAAKAIREATSEIDASRIAAVGCTGFGNGVFLVDEVGRPTRPGIVSVDHRAQPIVEQLIAEGRAQAMSDITGHRLWGGQTLMQLTHLARHEPGVMARTRWALACKDYIRYRLTGEALTDPTDASGGGLVDLATGDYATDVFDALGISAIVAKLPPIVENSGIGGRITQKAAAETGLKSGTPVAGSMMDVAACALGARVTGGRNMLMIAGTWAINCIETEASNTQSPPILNMLHRDRACRLIAEGSPSSAANLGWYLEQGLGRRISAATADQLVAASPVDVRRCRFLPYVHGPAPRSAAFIDLTATDNEATMLRAIFEAVAFQHRFHAEEVLPHAGGVWPATIRLAGGAARSAPWAQIFADVCQRPVEIVAADEVGALGAAICASVAGGVHRDLASASEKMARLGRRYEPDPALGDYYEMRFQEFRRLDRGMLSLMAQST